MGRAEEGGWDRALHDNCQSELLEGKGWVDLGRRG